MVAWENIMSLPLQWQPRSIMYNRPFSKMVAENSNKSKLKTYATTRKSIFTLVTLQSFSISGVISAEKMWVENWKI